MYVELDLLVRPYRRSIREGEIFDTCLLRRHGCVLNSQTDLLWNDESWEGHDPRQDH